MVIERCFFNRRIMTECYGDSTYNALKRRIIISSGAIIGVRNGILLWSHHMTMQLQDAPGRQLETRCTSGGIDHAFINYLVYGNKLRASGIKIRIYPHGEGIVNSLGGLKPDTVVGNITGNISTFWKLLNNQGEILNWSGEVSPVVHQLDHFLDELITITDTYLHSTTTTGNTSPITTTSGSGNIDSKKGFGMDLALKYKPRSTDSSYVDRAWQALAASQCLFDCGVTNTSSSSTI